MSLTEYLASRANTKKPGHFEQVRKARKAGIARRDQLQLHVHDLVVKYVRENRAGVDKQLNWTYRPANLIAVENLGVLTG